MGRLACVFVSVGPALRVSRQSATDRRKHVRRIALARLQKRPANLFMSSGLRSPGLRQVPNPNELLRTTTANRPTDDKVFAASDQPNQYPGATERKCPPAS